MANKKKSQAETGHKHSPHADLLIAQITDTHLYSNKKERLLGLNTLESCQQVIRLAKTNHPDLDMVIASGDLVHDGSQDGYETLRAEFEKMQTPTFCFPGNHDNPSTMQKYLNKGNVKTVSTTDLGNWSFIFLDSSHEDSEGGEFSDAQLDDLENQLSAKQGQHILIGMHHHPLPIGSAWMDTMVLKAPEKFLALIEKHPQVKGIIFGHIHQAFNEEYKGVKLMGAPSTCIQFLPQQKTFTLDQSPPGYRWLRLSSNGAIHTGISRLDRYSEPLDLSPSGY